MKSLLTRLLTAKTMSTAGSNEEQNLSTKFKQTLLIQDKGGSIKFLSIVLGGGSIFILLYSLNIGLDNFLSFVSVSMLIALTSGIVGAFVGFIFGIPRTPASKDSDNIGANTNLEEISDWITKIIVGVSLVQLNQISGRIQKLGEVLSAGLGGHPSSYVFSIAVVTFYFVGGFFLGYLWSRIYLPKILRTAVDEGQRLKAEVSELKVIKEKQENVIQMQATEMEESKNKEEERAEIRKVIDTLQFQSDPKNINQLDILNFSKEKMQALSERILDFFDKSEVSTLFGRIIVSLYNVGKYDVINSLADTYKDKIDINYSNWMDIAIANMNLYSKQQSQSTKIRMVESLENIRKTINDYGVTYAVEIYFGLIDYTEATKNGNAKKQAEALEYIQHSIDELKQKPDVSSFEAINYFKRNDHVAKWKEYNDTLKSTFVDDYQVLLEKQEKYIEVNPQYATEVLGNESQ
ncbi:MAG: hypothetical protein U5K79_10295 [Cyclobacteriaceae bacterium]|nr:hypothetical protein [Cyclobacteriaceae bacterium]